MATLRCVAKAADSLCDGDLVERKIRSSQNWGLLPLQVYITICKNSTKSVCITDGFLCILSNIVSRSTRVLFLVST